MQKRLRRHRQLGHGLPQRALGGTRIAREHPGPAQFGERIAGGVGVRRRLAQGLDGLAQRHTIAAPLRRRQPDVSQRCVHLGRVGKTIDGATQRDHRGILAARPRLRQAKSDNAFGARGIKGGERFELRDGPRMFAVERVDLRQCFTRRRLTGRGSPRGLLERFAGGGQVVEIALDQAEHVIGLAELRIDGEGLFERLNGGVDPAISVPRESKLVEYAGVPIIERDERFVLLNGAFVAAKTDVDIAKHLDGAQGAGIELGGAAQVAQGGLELVLGVVNGAAFQVGGHRFGIARDCTTVGFDGLEGPVGRHRLVAGLDLPVELAFVGHCGIRQAAGHTSHGDEYDREKGRPHGQKW